MTKQLNLILNGKGGVGKSFFAVNAVQALKDQRRLRGTGHPVGGGNKLDALAANASAPCLRWFSCVPNGALLALLRQGALYPVPCGVTGAPQTGEWL